MTARAASFLRSLFRYRLRTLLLVMLALSVAMGIYVNRVRRQQASIAAVKRLGGWTYYDYEIKEDGQYDPQGTSWAPDWLRTRLGDDYFHAVVQVNMVYNDDTGKRLDNSQMSDEVCSHLDGLPRLEMLLLHGTQASDEGQAHVGKLTHLRKLYIWNGVNVTDKGVAHLAGCRKLEYLHLSQSQIGDESARVFSQLPHLQGLSLQGNQLTDGGLVHLGKMVRLTDLWIGCINEARSPITDDGLARLGNLTELDTLELQQSQVTDAGLEHLTKLKKLRSLLLHGTKVSDPSRLQQALPQCQVDYK